MRPGRRVSACAAARSRRCGRFRTPPWQYHAGQLGRPQYRIEDVIEALADERHPEHYQDDGQPGEQTGPPDARGGVRQRLVQVVAPLGRGGWLDAETEETQTGQREDRIAGIE